MNDNWQTMFTDDLRIIYNDVKEKFDTIGNNYTPEDPFRCFNLVDPSDVKVIIIGQDPYPYRDGHIADGLSFSSVTKPASLLNIERALGGTLRTGDLSVWAQQGVLLMNVYLTKPKSKEMHTFWKPLTVNLIKCLCNYVETPLFICLWGGLAKSLKEYIPGKENIKILEWIHPSPMNDKNTFIKEDRRFKNCDHFRIISETYNIDWNLN